MLLILSGDYCADILQRVFLVRPIVIDVRSTRPLPPQYYRSIVFDTRARL